MQIIYSDKQLYWLDELNSDLYVEVKVQPLGDSSFNGEQTILNKVVPLSKLPLIKTRCSEANIWRSWCIYEDKNKTQKLGLVPLIIDIDDEDENIENAYILTRACVESLEARLKWISSKEMIRVVFSGRKGFHIEIKPFKSVDASEVRDDLIKECEMLGVQKGYMNCFIENTVVDTINPEIKLWVRVIDTIYSWYRESGELVRRKIFQMSFDEFLESDAKTILALAECHGLA